MCQIAIDIPSEPAKSMVSNASWIRKVAIEAVDRKNMFKARLHAGEVEPLMNLLIDDGLYIDQKTKELALKKAGEL